MAAGAKGGSAGALAGAAGGIERLVITDILCEIDPVQAGGRSRPCFQQ